MTFRANKFAEDCYIGWVLDEFGRLLAMYAATQPADFAHTGCQIVAALQD